VRPPGITNALVTRAGVLWLGTSEGRVMWARPGDVDWTVADLGSREKLAMQLLSMLLVLAGLLPLAATLLYGFKTMHVDVGHGVAGLYVGQLNEQHPWLYKALRLTNHPAGEDYRKRTRDHRGPLRGIDYILMRELVRIEESLEALRPARLVTEEVQLVTPVFDPGPPEPRLVAVPTAVGRFGS